MAAPEVLTAHGVEGNVKSQLRKGKPAECTRIGSIVSFIRLINKVSFFNFLLSNQELKNPWDPKLLRMRRGLPWYGKVASWLLVPSLVCGEPHGSAPTSLLAQSDIEMFRVMQGFSNYPTAHPSSTATTARAFG